MAWIHLQLCAAPTGKNMAFSLGRSGVSGPTSGVAFPICCSMAYITVKVDKGA